MLIGGSMLGAEPAAAMTCTNASNAIADVFRGAGTTVRSEVVHICSGEDVTGLTHEELWAHHCRGENFGFRDYEPGDTVVFRFTTISNTNLERLAELQEQANDAADESNIERPDWDSPWTWEDHNRYFPQATIDATQIYTTVNIRCVSGPGNGEPGSIREWGIIIVRAVTDFVDPEALRGIAEERLQLPEPALAGNPPLDDPDRFSVVRIPTWLWLDDPWETVGPEEEVDGPAAVAVAAHPTYVHWDTGDGGTVICNGPGVVWQPGMDDDGTYCSHTYERPSAGSGPVDAYELSATVHWTYVWWVNGTYLGPYATDSTSTTITHQVGEIQAVGTAPDTD